MFRICRNSIIIYFEYTRADAHITLGLIVKYVEHESNCILRSKELGMEFSMLYVKDASKMRIRLVLVLAHIQFILIGIYAHPYRLTLYRTKTPSYVMRGSMDTPVKPVDYCQKGLCPKGERHICCKNEFVSCPPSNPSRIFKLQLFHASGATTVPNRARASTWKGTGLPFWTIIIIYGIVCT